MRLIKMSNKYKILELLKEQELTVKEIADKTEFNENETRVYIHRLLKDNLIKEIGKKNRYVIYTAIEKESNNNLQILLNNLYSLMNNKMDFIKTPDSQDIELIKNIELVIKQ